MISMMDFIFDEEYNRRIFDEEVKKEAYAKGYKYGVKLSTLIRLYNKSIISMKVAAEEAGLSIKEFHKELDDEQKGRSVKEQNTEL